MKVIEILEETASFLAACPAALATRRFDVNRKADGSPVTAADVWLEREIAQRLAAALPQLSVIGEESFTGAPAQAGWVALIDPIDGTENFCSGLREWGVAIGIWRDGVHAGSLLQLPEMGLRIRTGESPGYVPASRITGFSSSYCEEIGNGIRDAAEYRVSGCAVFNLYHVITGAFARFVNPKGARVWDLLPGLALALEHGCEVWIEGRPYRGELLDPAGRYRVDVRHRYDLHRR